DPLRWPEKRRQHLDRDAHSLVLRATERTADKVQQPAYALAPHLRRDRFPLRTGEELRQSVRDMRLIAGQRHLLKSPGNRHPLLPCCPAQRHSSEAQKQLLADTAGQTLIASAIPAAKSSLSRAPLLYVMRQRASRG